MCKWCNIPGRIPRAMGSPGSHPTHAFIGQHSVARQRHDHPVPRQTTSACRSFGGRNPRPGDLTQCPGSHATAPPVEAIDGVYGATPRQAKPPPGHHDTQNPMSSAGNCEAGPCSTANANGHKQPPRRPGLSRKQDPGAREQRSCLANRRPERRVGTRFLRHGAPTGCPVPGPRAGGRRCGPPSPPTA
jgi:hypothetical protein